MDQDAVVRLACQTLLEVVENAQNIEICIILAGNKSSQLEEDKLEAICSVLKKEKDEAEASKKNKIKD